MNNGLPPASIATRKETGIKESTFIGLYTLSDSWDIIGFMEYQLKANVLQCIVIRTSLYEISMKVSQKCIYIVQFARELWMEITCIYKHIEVLFFIRRLLSFTRYSIGVSQLMILTSR